MLHYGATGFDKPINPTLLNYSIHVCSLWSLAEGYWQRPLNFNIHKKQHLLYPQYFLQTIFSCFSWRVNQKIICCLKCSTSSAVSSNAGCFFFLSLHITAPKAGKRSYCCSFLSLLDNSSSHFHYSPPVLYHVPCDYLIQHIYLTDTIICQLLNHSYSL